MRTVKILSLVLAVVMLTAAFSACGSASFEKIFNDDYDFTVKSVKSTKELSELEGFAYDTSNSDFAIFNKAGINEEDSASVAHKVYSFISKRVVGVFTTTSKYQYEIELCDNIPAFVVKGTKVDSSDEDTEVTTTLYNSKGVKVASANEEVETKAVGDMFIFNYAAYVENDEGGIEKKLDVPEYLMIENISDCTEEYIYYLDDDNKRFIVYNTEFAPVATWVAPSYANIYNDFFILNNGNVLVQYTKKLVDETEDYDYYAFDADGDLCKYDLMTVIIEADGGDVDEIDLEYLISDIYTNYMAYDEDEENNYCTDNFENIAIVKPIVDGVVDGSAIAKDIVLMDNDGDIDGSLKLVEGQTADLPRLFDEGKYYVKTVFGTAIVEDDGTVIQHFNNDNVSIEGRYIVTEKAIYDSDMKKIYELKKNKASVVGAIDNTIFVSVKNGSSDSIIAFRGSAKKTITSSTASEEFMLLPEFGGYRIYDVSTDKYSYYTVDGKLIKTFDTAVTMISFSRENGAIIVTYLSEGKICYSLFLK